MSDPLPTLPISLTGLETVALLDSVRNGSTITEKENELSCLEDVVLKLSSLYRELVTSKGIADGPLVVEVTRDEAWLLRSKVRTGDLAIDGLTNVGVLLSLKLYELLGRFESHVEESFDSAATDGPPLGVDEREALKALQMTEEMNRAGRNQKPRPGSYRSPSG